MELKTILEKYNYMKNKNPKYEAIFNRSFNEYKINAPQECGFACIQVVDQFFDKLYLDNFEYSEDKYDEVLQGFYDFFGAFLQKVRGKGVEGFFKERLTIWKLNSKNDENPILNYSDDYIFAYLFKTFILNTFNGYIREERSKAIVYEAASTINLKLDIRKDTADNDVNKCIDLIVSNECNEIFCQIKPVSFFKSLPKKGTSSSSMLKIDRAMRKYNIPLFIGIYDDDNSELYFLVRDKKSKMVKKVSPLEFGKLFEKKIPKESLISLAHESSSRLLTMSKL